MSYDDGNDDLGTIIGGVLVGGALGFIAGKALSGLKNTSVNVSYKPALPNNADNNYCNCDDCDCDDDDDCDCDDCDYDDDDDCDCDDCDCDDDDDCEHDIIYFDDEE